MIGLHIPKLFKTASVQDKGKNKHSDMRMRMCVGLRVLPSLVLRLGYPLVGHSVLECSSTRTCFHTLYEYNNDSTYLLRALTESLATRSIIFI